MINSSRSGLVLFSGNGNPALSEEISKQLGVKLGQANVTTFSDGEISISIDENVRGKDVFLIQPTCAPAGDNLLELIIMVDALRRSSAGRITAVIPYYGYADKIDVLDLKECQLVQKLWPIYWKDQE